MAFRFKIWDQGHDGSTMGIRVRDLEELRKLASVCTSPDMRGRYTDLRNYLAEAEQSTEEPPDPYVRLVDVVWFSELGYNSNMYFVGRRFLVTYTGTERQSGGFACQGYCIVDERGYSDLKPHEGQQVKVDYIASSTSDAIVVQEAVSGN